MTTETLPLTVEELVRLTCDTYEDIIDPWERDTLNDPPIPRIVQALHSMAKNIPQVPDRRILDLGCGFGEYCKFLEDRGLAYTGVDVSEKVIERALALNPERGRFLQRDFHKLGCLGLFDCFCAIQSFQHVVMGHMPGVLKAIRRNVKEGALGYLVVYDGYGASLEYPSYPTTHKAYIAHYSLPDLRAFLNISDFQITSHHFDQAHEIHHLEVKAVAAK